MLTSNVSDRAFSLSFKGRTVFSHNDKKPCIVYGRGAGEIIISHGMYHLKKEKFFSRISPERFSLIETQSGITVDFDDTVTLTAEVIDERLHISFSCSESSINRFWIHLPASYDERIYGCGEQFSKQNLRGGLVPLWTSEPGVGRGHDIVTLGANIHSGIGGAWHHTYFPQPTFLSSDNWYCHAEASAYAEFDFRQKRRHTLFFWQVPVKIIIGVDTSAPGAIGSLSAYLGRQPELPEWAYNGMWLAVQGGAGVVEKKINAALDAGIRVGAVWSQDWQGIRMTRYGKQLMWNWEYDPLLYPDLPVFIRQLHEKGVRFLGYNNPFLAEDGPQFHEASKQGYLVKTRDGADYITYTTTFPVGIVDFTNPDARDWFKTIIKEKMIGAGLDGWMADFAEYIPPDSVLYDGDPCLYHNRYPVEWARLNREALEETNKVGEVVFFTRSGYTGESRYSTLMWAGDQLVSFHKNNGFPTVIAAGLSAGISGMGLFSFDIGGFLSIAHIRRSAELWMRSAEMGAFTQVMRSHEGINPKVNKQFDSSREITEHLARMTEIYVALKPWHQKLAAEYRVTGLPPMRYPWVHYEEDKGLYDLKYQYLYGRDLMVAPVIKKRQWKKKVYLPDDRWIHLWTGKEYSQGWCRVAVPLGEPAVFYRADSPDRELFKKVGEI